MYSRRIWLLKLIFLLLWILYGSDFQKMKGFKFSRPSPLFGGVISVLAPYNGLCTYCCHFLTNFSNERVVLWVLKCHKFIYATFKSTRSVLNRLPVHRMASRRGMSFEFNYCFWDRKCKTSNWNFSTSIHSLQSEEALSSWSGMIYPA